jgi:hypothetical protein
MHPTLPSRKSLPLSSSCTQSLNAYALAAGAAGVSLLALAPPAEAKVVFTPAHVVIGGLNGVQSYSLDVDNNGVADFALQMSSSCDIDRCFLNLDGAGNKFGYSMVIGANAGYALALPGGTPIGPHQKFTAVAVLGGYYADFRGVRDIGDWVNVKHHYLGLRFLINGKTHFGWARLSVAVNGNHVAGILTGYAYETIAGKPIIAGQTSANENALKPEAEVFAAPDRSPATLGLLAQGAGGLQAWRREEL